MSWRKKRKIDRVQIETRGRNMKEKCECFTTTEGNIGICPMHRRLMQQNSFLKYSDDTSKPK